MINVSLSPHSVRDIAMWHFGRHLMVGGSNLAENGPGESAMIPFDAAHRAVHYPNDRRLRIWVRSSILIGLAAVVLGRGPRLLD